MKMPNKDNSMQKLLGFVQIQKIGYPDPRESYPKGFNMNQSSGLPEPGSKEGQRIGEIARKMQPNDYMGGSSPLHGAHSYIKRLQEDEVQTPRNQEYVNPDVTQMNIQDHLMGHQYIATVHNILAHGEDYLHHPDALNYKEPVDVDIPPGYTNGMMTNMSVSEFHKNLVNSMVSPDTSQNTTGLADDLHRRIRQVSPTYHPDDSGYSRLQNPASQYGGESVESAPLPPEGEGKLEFRDGDVREDGKGIKNIPYNPGDTPEDRAWPIERYGRNYRELFSSPRIGRGREGRESSHDYPSMRSRREDYRTMSGALEEPSKEESVPPKSKAQNAFEQRFPDLYGDKEKAVTKLRKFMRKEGAGGGDGGGDGGGGSEGGEGGDGEGGVLQ